VADKKKHKNHYEEAEDHAANKFRKQRNQEFEDDNLGFDEDDEPLYNEVMRFLKK